MNDSARQMEEDMEMVLAVLQKFGRKMTESELYKYIGPLGGQTERGEGAPWWQSRSLGEVLYCLLMRNRVRCDSFDPSKRGGQAGVRRWGGGPFTALWEAVEDENPPPEEDPEETRPD